MGRKSAFLKYDTISTEITCDGGCRSSCTSALCPAMAIKACEGCCKCEMETYCDNNCSKCMARCWKRTDLATWLADVDGLDLGTASCSRPFDGALSSFVPQISGKVWNVYHPAYAVSIKRIIDPATMRWIYKKRGIREALSIPTGVELLLSFCVRDKWLEYIWTYQHADWGQGKNFWESLAEFGFDAALSVDFSCYRDFPRMDHAICLKRNVLTAERLSKAGIPVILDVLTHSDIDRERMYDWGLANGLRWYHMNYQFYKNVGYMNDIIKRRCDRLFERLPHARLVVTGIADLCRVSMLTERYKGRISFINSSAYMNTIYYRRHDSVTDRWVKENSHLPELWQRALGMYG